MLCCDTTDKTLYFDHAGERCLSCSKAVWRSMATLLIMLVPAALFCALASAGQLKYVRGLDLLTAKLSSASSQAHLKGVIKLLISMGQILSQVSDVYEVTTPKSLRGVVDAYSIISGHLFHWVPTFNSKCLGLHNSASVLVALTVTPLLIIALIWSCVPLRRSSVETAMRYTTYCLFLVFPPITPYAFRALRKCDCFDDDPQRCFLKPPTTNTRALYTTRIRMYSDILGSY
jgi:hypothetical protein